MPRPVADAIIDGEYRWTLWTAGMAKDRDRKNAAFLIALLGLRGVGRKTVASLLSAERSRILASENPDADLIEILATTGGSRAAVAILRALVNSEATWEELAYRAYDSLEVTEERGVLVLHPLMDSYPERLLRRDSFPPLLYCKGDLAALNTEKAVAIVGTRQPSEFGRRMARRLAQVLAEDGYAVVSGLALGCDAAGHEGALDVGGRTVAVLPTPPDAPTYPRQNQELAGRILESGGALISEYSPGEVPDGRQLAGNLVSRDEWQPALSDGLVAAETSADGGTRHAVEHALSSGVPVGFFDYRANEKLRGSFETDSRFAGNMLYLTSDRGISPIYGPESVDAFKLRMDGFRAGWGISPGDDGQQMLRLV